MKKIIRLVYPGLNMNPVYKDISNEIGSLRISEAKNLLKKQYPEAIFCLIGKNLNVPIILQEGQNIGREEFRVSFGVPIETKYNFVSNKGVVLHNYGRMLCWF